MMATRSGSDLPTLRRGLLPSLLLLCVVVFEVSSRCNATSRGIQIEGMNFRRSALTSGAAASAAHQDASKSMHITSSCDWGTRCPRTTHSTEWKPDTMHSQMVHMSSRPGSSATTPLDMSESGCTNSRNSDLEKSRKLREDVTVKMRNLQRMRNSEGMRDLEGKMDMNMKDPAEASRLRDSELMTDLHRKRNTARNSMISDERMVKDQTSDSGADREFENAIVNTEGHENSRIRDIEEGSKWGAHVVDHENKRGIEFVSQGNLESNSDGMRDATEIEDLPANRKTGLNTRETQMWSTTDMRARESSQAMMDSTASNSRASVRFVDSDSRRGVWAGDETQMEEPAATLRDFKQTPMGMDLETDGQSNELPKSEKIQTDLDKMRRWDALRKSERSSNLDRKASAHSDMWRGGEEAFINSDRSREMEGSQEKSMSKTGHGTDFEGMQGYLYKSEVTRDSNMMTTPSERRRDSENKWSSDRKMQNWASEKLQMKSAFEGRNQIPSHEYHENESEMTDHSEWMPQNRMTDAVRGNNFYIPASGDLERTMHPDSDEISTRDTGITEDSQSERMSAATSANLRDTAAKARFCQRRSCNKKDGDVQRMDSTIRGSEGMHWHSRDSMEAEVMGNNRVDDIFQSESIECNTHGADCRVVRDGRNRASKDMAKDQETMMDTSSSTHKTVPNSCGPNGADCQRSSAHEGTVGSRMIGQGHDEDYYEDMRFSNIAGMSPCNGQCRKFEDTNEIMEERMPGKASDSMHTEQMDQDMMGFEKISNADTHGHWTSSDLERMYSKIPSDAERMRSSSERLPTTFKAADHEGKALMEDHDAHGMGHINTEMMSGSKSTLSDQTFGLDIKGANMGSGHGSSGMSRQEMDHSFSQQSNINTEMTGPRMETSVWSPKSARNTNLKFADGSEMIDSELQAGMSRAGNIGGNSCPNGMKCANGRESDNHVVHMSFTSPRHSNPGVVHLGHSGDSKLVQTGTGSLEMSEKRSTITMEKESRRSDRTRLEAMHAEQKNDKSNARTKNSNNKQMDWTRKVSQAQHESHL